MHRETLALREKVLGKEHPSTLVSIGNLAAVLDSLGRHKEAASMNKEVQADHNNTLAGTHVESSLPDRMLKRRRLG
jgi:hypothetical protein